MTFKKLKYVSDINELIEDSPFEIPFETKDALSEIPFVKLWDHDFFGCCTFEGGCEDAEGFEPLVPLPVFVLSVPLPVFVLSVPLPVFVLSVPFAVFCLLNKLNNPPPTTFCVL